jgi:hypothetical protein
MRKIGGAVRSAVCGAALMLVALPGISAAAEHGGMGGMTQGAPGDHGGMKMGDHGTMKPGGHDMTTMGDKVFSGKIGVWMGTARIVDMKAHMGASGMKAQGAMPNSHHIAFELTDPNTKKAVTEGAGKVTVTGPDKKETKVGFMVMEGHFGTDVNLPAPGKYTFQAEIESGVQKGSATFSYTVK